MPEPVPVTFGPARRRLSVSGVLVVASCGICLLCMGVILVPIFQSAKAAARTATAMERLKRLGAATLEYAYENDDHFPPVMASAYAVESYVRKYVPLNAGTEGAADAERLFESANPSGGRILGDKWLGRQTAGSVIDPSQTVMFYDEKPWGDRGLAFFADGRVQFKPLFSDLMNSLKIDPINHTPDITSSKP